MLAIQSQPFSFAGLLVLTDVTVVVPFASSPGLKKTQKLNTMCTVRTVSMLHVRQ